MSKEKPHKQASVSCLAGRAWDFFFSFQVSLSPSHCAAPGTESWAPGPLRSGGEGDESELMEEYDTCSDL